MINAVFYKELNLLTQIFYRDLTMISHELIKEALTIRKVEEKFLELFTQGKLNGTVHTCVGQEFSAVGFCGQLQQDDFVFSNHRCHGHYISFTKDWKSLIAELMGKKDGICQGIGSSQHLYNSNFFSNGIQGGIVPVAAGIALSKKLIGANDIGIVFIGDGTLGEGVVYETMNIVSKWNIPLLIVCENNFYAQSTEQKTNLAGSIIKRAESFDIKTFESKIWDTGKFLTQAQESINYVRDNCKPAFHLVDLYRLNPHSKGDDFRNIDEINKYHRIDPLNIFSKENPEFFKKFEEEIEEEINNYVQDTLKTDKLTIEEYYNPIEQDYSDEWEEIDTIDKRQIQLINEFFHEQMETNNDLLFIGEDVLSPYGGAFKAAKNLSDKYPEKVFSTPISEAAITGISNGLALGGFRPFLEIMFGDFTTLCMDQIINHASKFYHMYSKQVNCPIVVRTPMGGGRGYGPTHSQTLDKFLVGIDNITTVALNTLLNPKDIYSTILNKESHPVIIIENKTDYGKKIASNKIKNFTFEKNNADYPIVRVKHNRIKANATIVTYGGATDTVLNSIKPLFLELEIIPEIIVLSKIHPIDYFQIIESVKKTKKLYVVEEGTSAFGIGSEIIATVKESITENFVARRIAALPVPIPSVKSLEEVVLPSVEKIIYSIGESYESIARDYSSSRNC